MPKILIISPPIATKTSFSVLISGGSIILPIASSNTTIPIYRIKAKYPFDLRVMDHSNWKKAIINENIKFSQISSKSLKYQFYRKFVEVISH